MSLSLCRRNRLPLPAIGVRIDHFVVDFLWPKQRLIVETDGFRHHGTRSAFESDRERDVRLQMLGYTVVRFTYKQVTDDPDAVVVALAALLARPAGGGAR